MWLESKWFIIIYLILSFPNGSLAQEATNLQLLSNLADSLLRPVIQENVTQGIETVALRNLAAKHEDAWFFEQRITASLKAAGVRSILLATYVGDSLRLPQPSLILEYRPLGLSIQYQALSRTNHQGTDRYLVSRTGSVDLYLRIVSYPSGALVWDGEVAGRQTDSVSSDNLEELEQPEIAFTKGQLQPVEDNRLVQALVVSVVTGAIVYLFYALRSR